MLKISLVFINVYFLRLQGMQENFNQQMSIAAESKNQQQAAACDNAVTRDSDDGGQGSDHVAKLLGERDTLLQTGVYTTDDPVIAELDREIRQLITVGNT